MFCTETILISYTPLSIYVFAGCIYYYFNISFIFLRLVCLCCLHLWIVLFYFPFGILQRLLLYFSNTNGDIQFNAYRPITVWMYKAENTMNVILCKLLLNCVFGNKNNIITAVTVLLMHEETAVSG